MGIQKQKSCFSCYSSQILGILKIKTNHMQLIAAYMQLVTPSEVAMAVRMLMAI